MPIAPQALPVLFFHVRYDEAKEVSHEVEERMRTMQAKTSKGSFVPFDQIHANTLSCGVREIIIFCIFDILLYLVRRTSSSLCKLCDTTV